MLTLRTQQTIVPFSVIFNQQLLSRQGWQGGDMGKLTTHVLDTTRGKPGAGITVALYQLSADQRTFVRQLVTNSDGRCDEALLEGHQLCPGVYELVFSVGPYFETFEPASSPSNKPRFLDDVVIRFGIASVNEHYHVPLLITPYSYSTYRGS